MKCSKIYDQRCVIGTITSILQDIELDSNNKNKIKTVLEEKTENNTTYVKHSELIDLFSPYFNFEVFEILQKSDFQDIFIPSESFCILLWNGDYNNQNIHCTRLCSIKNPEIIQLMDSTKEQDNESLIDDLFIFSPKGFILIIFQRK